MRISITHKLFLAILTASVMTVMTLLVAMEWNLKRGFLRYNSSMEQTALPRLATELESRYTEKGTWDFIRRDREAWSATVSNVLQVPRHELQRPPRQSIPTGPPHHGPEHLQPPPPPMPPFGPPPQHAPDSPPFAGSARNLAHLPPHMAQALFERLFLMDVDRSLLAGQYAPEGRLVTLRTDNKVVGYLGILPLPGNFDLFQQRFMREQKSAFVIVGLAVIILAAAFSMLLASRMIKPLKLLAAASHRLASGSHDVRVPFNSRDEVGQLADDFNKLAQALEKNEQTRRQWVADISHELRTPLSVLRGEIEAFQDGIRTPTPEAITSLHVEVMRLARLIEDLFQLSLSDVCAMSCQKTELDCNEMLLDAINAYQGEFTAKQITLQTTIATPAPTVFADGERLHQLFDNLLENSLKYTDKDGKLLINTAYNDNWAEIYFEDSAPGVPAASLERLFDRLYRVESSRNRTLGGAGLGLSICKSIVEAHNGSIEAHPSSLGGLRIVVRLPLQGGVA